MTGIVVGNSVRFFDHNCCVATGKPQNMLPVSSVLPRPWRYELTSGGLLSIWSSSGGQAAGFTRVFLKTWGFSSKHAEKHCLLVQCNYISYQSRWYEIINAIYNLYNVMMESCHTN